ncbi:MAG: hypothetical protein M1136_12195 [Chloroflexi bacterium]|nr:hypothetical protein [Chloroflexota bacterium]MCL5076384.1 hypothetical protein [Chloroflexota bacterium]
MESWPRWGLSNGRQAIVLSSIVFSLSFVLGFLIVALWPAPAPQGYLNEEYIVLVSNLYDQEKDIGLARERLAVLGEKDMAGAVAALANVYPQLYPQKTADAASLHQLAAALTQTNLAPTSAAGERDVSQEKESALRSDPLSALIRAIMLFALMCALVITAILSFRSLGDRRPLAVGSSLLAKFVGSRESRSFFGGTRKRQGKPWGDRAEQPLSEESGIKLERSAPATRIATRLRTGPLPQSRPEKILSFQSHYEMGEDPYDEIHPVIDRLSGRVIGACGLSSAAKFGRSSPGRYYAFTAWAHDYLSGESLKSIALVSRWLQSEKPHIFSAWIEKSSVDQVIPVQEKATATLETANLRIDLTILEATYESNEDQTETCFSRLVVKFDTKIKQPLPREGSS